MDGSVKIEPYSGKDVATIRIGNHFYGFEFKEELNKKSNKRKVINENSDESGTLALLIMVQSSSDGLNKNLEYRDVETEPLEIQLRKILYNLFVISNKLDLLDELASREFYYRWVEDIYEQYLEKLKKNETEWIDKLENMVSDWDRAQKIRCFAESVEKNIPN